LTLERPLRGGEKESKMERINEGRKKLGDGRDERKTLPPEINNLVTALVALVT